MFYESSIIECTDAKISSNVSLKTIATVKTIMTSRSGRTLKLKTRPSSTSTGTERQQQILKNTELMRGAILLENQIKLTVNFNNKVFDVIREVRDFRIKKIYQSLVFRRIITFSRTGRAVRALGVRITGSNTGNRHSER